MVTNLRSISPNTIWHNFSGESIVRYFTEYILLKTFYWRKLICASWSLENGGLGSRPWSCHLNLLWENEYLAGLTVSTPPICSSVMVAYSSFLDRRLWRKISPIKSSAAPVSPLFSFLSMYTLADDKEHTWSHDGSKCTKHFGFCDELHTDFTLT